MTANEFFKAGRLTEAGAAAGEDVKRKPGDQRARVFLFELLCFSGDLARAQKQLDAVAANDIEVEVSIARYRNLLAAEANRRKVMTGRARPHIPGQVPAYVEAHLEAAKN